MLKNKVVHVGPLSAVLHAALLPDPAAVFGGLSVDAGLVSAGTAVAPTYHARQKDCPAGAGDGERPPGVALEDEQVSGPLTGLGVSFRWLLPDRHPRPP